MTASRIVVVMGAGGVGKSTYSAALAARLASDVPGRRVLLITVDPARRLASSMGVTTNRNDVVEVSLANDDVSFFVSMLDAQDAWDSLIARIAPNPETADRVLSNSLYRNITGRFVNSHDYIAIERLWEVANSGEFDTIVVDTPPSRNALSVLDASERMREFFASRLLKWLTLPASNRLVGLTSRPFFALADRVLGARFLSDVAEFFALFRTMEASFSLHAEEVGRLLRVDGTSFVVVTTSDAAPVAEADYLIDQLRERNLTLGTVVVNRALDPAAVAQARAAADRTLPAEWSAVVGDFLESADREAGVVGGLVARHRCEVVTVPESARAVNDVATVCELGASLPVPRS